VLHEQSDHRKHEPASVLSRAEGEQTRRAARRRPNRVPSSGRAPRDSLRGPICSQWAAPPELSSAPVPVGLFVVFEKSDQRGGGNNRVRASGLLVRVAPTLALLSLVVPCCPLLSLALRCRPLSARTGHGCAGDATSGSGASAPLEWAALFLFCFFTRPPRRRANSQKGWPSKLGDKLASAGRPIDLCGH